MKNKLLLVIVAALIAGCADKVEYETALKDPITLNLVKQSVLNQCGAPALDYTHYFYNSCSLYSRFKFFLFIEVFPAFGEYRTYKPASCGALDLRLDSKGIDVSASSLVEYYRNELADEQLKAEDAAKQTQIENMANGK